MNAKRVHRFWKEVGLQVPMRGSREGWGARGVCERVYPAEAGVYRHVWSYDFLNDRTEPGRQREDTDVRSVESRPNTSPRNALAKRTP